MNYGILGIVWAGAFCAYESYMVSSGVNVWLHLPAALIQSGGLVWFYLAIKGRG